MSHFTKGIPKNDPEDPERPIRPTVVKGVELKFRIETPSGSFFDSPKNNPQTEKRPTD